VQTAHIDPSRHSAAAPAPRDWTAQADVERLAAYARKASLRRGLTAGELADDLADKLAALAGSELEPAPAQPFLETLVGAFAGSRHRIHVTCDPGLRLVPAELAPVGMVVSEAIANALKYAFPEDRNGDIWVRLTENRGRVSLGVRDNGVGMLDTVGDRLSGRGLIETIAHQLGGYARLGSATFGGAEVTVVFPPAC